jgi:hypothetical protein
MGNLGGVPVLMGQDSGRQGPNELVLVGSEGGARWCCKADLAMLSEEVANWAAVTTRGGVVVAFPPTPRSHIS